MSHDGKPDRSGGLLDRAVRETEMGGHPSQRAFKLRQLYQAEPLPKRETIAVDPAPAQVVKGVATAAASAAIVGQTINPAGQAGRPGAFNTIQNRRPTRISAPLAHQRLATHMSQDPWHHPTSGAKLVLIA